LVARQTYNFNHVRDKQMEIVWKNKTLIPIFSPETNLYNQTIKMIVFKTKVRGTLGTVLTKFRRWILSRSQKKTVKPTNNEYEKKIKISTTFFGTPNCFPSIILCPAIYYMKKIASKFGAEPKNQITKKSKLFQKLILLLYYNL